MQKGKVARNTKQRQLILNELKRLHSHPTADEIYIAIKKRLPQISLATVYRNLEFLSESGMILKLETAGQQKRFDGNPSNHYHARCIKCGSISDIPSRPLPSIRKFINKISNFEVKDYRLKLIGICPKCKKTKNKTSKI